MVAQAGGAAALVIINTDEGLAEMGCANNGTALNITLPVVMISKIGGDELKKSMASGRHGQPALLYLVPCTLGTCVVLGLIRGELKQLWAYNADDKLPIGEALE